MKLTNIITCLVFFFSLSYAGTARFHNINMDSSFTVKRCVGTSTLDSLFGIQNGSRVMKAAPTSALTVDSARAAYKADSLTCLYAQIKTVAKGCGQFTTIQDAINSITDASSTKRYCVYVYPGLYTEQVTMKKFVDLAGVNKQTTQIQFTGNNNGTIILSDSIQINDISVKTTAPSTEWGVVGTNVGEVFIRDFDVSSPTYYAGFDGSGIKFTGTIRNVRIERTVINCHSATGVDLYVSGNPSVTSDPGIAIHDSYFSSFDATTGGCIYIKDQYDIMIMNCYMRTSASGYNLKTERSGATPTNVTLSNNLMLYGTSSVEVGSNCTLYVENTYYSSIANSGTVIPLIGHRHNNLYDSIADTAVVRVVNGKVGIAATPGNRYLRVRQQVEIMGNTTLGGRGLVESITSTGREYMIFRADSVNALGAGLNLFGNDDGQAPGAINLYTNNKVRLRIDSNGTVDSIYAMRMRWLANYATDSVLTARGDGMVGYRSAATLDVDSARAASIADSTKKNAPHGVTSGYVSFSEGTNLWDETDMRYSETYTNFGVGIAAASNVKFYVNSGATNALRYNLYALNQPNVTTTGSYGAYGFNFYTYTSLSNGANDSGSYYGAYGRVLHSDTGYVGSLDGMVYRFGTTIASATAGAIGGMTLQPYKYGETVGNFSCFSINSPLGTGAVGGNRLCLNILDTAISEFQGGIRIDSDTKRFWIGEDQDASIYHDGSNAIYTTTTGCHDFAGGTVRPDSIRIGSTGSVISNVSISGDTLIIISGAVTKKYLSLP